MRIEDFELCTPPEFYAIWEQWSRRVERAEWERTRALMLSVLQPHSKSKLRPHDVLPMPWDNEAQKFTGKSVPRADESREELMARFAEAKAKMGLR